MFKKIVSDLPFHPAALDRVNTYFHLLSKACSIRKIGFVLVFTALALQIFESISPIKPSLTTSFNDLVYGASSKEQILKAYNDNLDSLGRTDIKVIYDHYGIGANQISASESQKIESRDKNYIITGRSTSHSLDAFINIVGASGGGIYQKRLTSWDTASRQSLYSTVTGMSSFGFRFWILLDGGGNIAFEESALSSNLKIVKSNLPAMTANLDNRFNYSIQFQNTGPGTATNVVITDTLPVGLDFIGYTSNLNLELSQAGKTLSWKIANGNSELVPGQRWYAINLVIRANETLSSEQACSAAYIAASGVSLQATNSSCVTITTPTCPGNGLPVPADGISSCQTTCPDGSITTYNNSCEVPQLTCQYLKIIDSPSWNSRKYETSVISQPGAIADHINYYVNDKEIYSMPLVYGLTQQYTHVFPDEGIYTFRAELTATKGTVIPNQNCSKTETIIRPSNPQFRILTNVKIENVTKNIRDADGTTASAGDKLKYTINIMNSGDADCEYLKLDSDYAENISDILEYATLIDAGDAEYNEKAQSLSWPTVSIPAGSSINKSFIVQIGNPLHNTPVSTSNPLSYDFDLQNSYGRLSVVHIKKPIAKTIERAFKKLPSISFNTAIAVSVLLVIFSGLFFIRDRLLIKELDIARQIYNARGKK